MYWNIFYSHLTSYLYLRILYLCDSMTSQMNYHTACSGRTRQHNRIGCDCLLRSDQYNNIQYDQVKPENTVKLRTRMT